MLYSARMDRGDSSGRVTELFHGVLKKTVGFRWNFLKSNPFD